MTFVEPHRWHDLATYNSEVARGIMHTPEWRERMRVEQARFDWEQGQTVNRPGSPPPPAPPVILKPAAEGRGLFWWRHK